MVSSDHPKVEPAFIIDKILKCGKVNADSYTKVGNTTSFTLKGTKPLHKRLITIREIDGELSFLQATNLAILFGFMGDLLKWFEDNKDWKEGAHIVKKAKSPKLQDVIEEEEEEEEEEEGE